MLSRRKFLEITTLSSAAFLTGLGLPDINKNIEMGEPQAIDKPGLASHSIQNLWENGQGRIGCSFNLSEKKRSFRV